MQIKHLNGCVLLSGPDLSVATATGDPFISTVHLTEGQTEQLLADNSLALRQALTEARSHNAEAKSKKIKELREQIARLEESMRPVPVQQKRREPKV